MATLGMNMPTSSTVPAAATAAANYMANNFWISALFFMALLFCSQSLPLLTAQNPSTCKGPLELERAVGSRPSAGAYNALGAYFAQRNQFTCAIPAFESALRLEPNSVETRYNLGLALMQKGDRKQAATELRKVVLEKPDLVNARNA